MTKAEAKKLIATKGPVKGEQAGRLLLAGIFIDTRNLLHRTQEEQLSTQEELNSVLRRVTAPAEKDVLELYRALFYAVKNSFNELHRLYQTFTSSRLKLLKIINETGLYGNLKRTELKNPYIISAAAYKKANKASDEKIHSEEHTLEDLFFYLTENINLLTEDAFPKSVFSLYLKALTRLNTNKRVISKLGEVRGPKGRTLPDGTKEAETNPAQWERAVINNYAKVRGLELPIRIYKNPLKEEILEQVHSDYNFLLKCYYDGIDSLEAFKERYPYDVAKEIEEEEDYLATLTAMLKALESHESKPNINRLLDSLGTLLTLERYKPHTTELEGALNEYVLGRSRKLYYSTDNSKRKELFNEFKEDYPELSEALLAFILQEIPAFKDQEVVALDDLQDPEDLPEIFNAFFYREPNKKDLIEALERTGNYTKQEIIRMKLGGIAVEAFIKLRGGKVIEEQIPKDQLLKNRLDLSKEDLDAEDIRLYRDLLIIPLLTAMYKFYAFFHALAEIYNIEELALLDYFKKDIPEEIEHLNSAVHLLYLTAYGEDQEEIAHARRLIKEHLKPIKEEEYLPSEKEVDAYKALLKRKDKLLIAYVIRQLDKIIHGSKPLKSAIKEFYNE